MDQNIIFTTATPESRISHKIIMTAVQQKEEFIAGRELYISRPASTKMRPVIFFRYLGLCFYSFVKGYWIRANAVDLHYRKVRLGKYAIASALRAPNAYKNIIIYYLRIFQSLYIGVLRINDFINISDQIVAIYVNDPSYINGIYCDLAIVYRIPLYHNTYPYTLTRFTGAAQNHLSDYFYVTPIDLPNSINLGKNIYFNILNDTNKISYMESIEFSENDQNIEIDQIYAVIYAHSFTDAQQAFEGDLAFRSVYEWLLFTIKALHGKKIIIKAHPSFFAEGYETDVNRWDRKIWDKFVCDIGLNNNVQVIDWAMQNSHLLNKLSAETILISHHGNALLEGGGMGFRCICSSSTPWAKFNLFNTWVSSEQYLNMLMNPSGLKLTSPDLIYRYMSNLYCNENSFFASKGWRYVAERLTGISAIDLAKNVHLLDDVEPEIIAEIICEVSGQIGEIDLSGK